MEIVRGDYFLLNGNFVESQKIYDYLVSGSKQVYEVLRIINSKAIFLGDHIDRLKLSVSGLGKKIPEELVSSVKRGISEIADKNKIKEGNVKILVQFSNKIETFIYFIPHSYPQVNDYIEGVEVGLFNTVRENPNVKAVSLTRGKINSVIKERNVYEVLLVDDLGNVTEGSRTNVFFIDNLNNVVTSPDDSVLKGITRKYAIQVCSKYGIPLIFKKIQVSELANYQSVFLTGTSPKILPVKKIENITFDVNSPVLGRIMEDYESILSSF